MPKANNFPAKGIPPIAVAAVEASAIAFLADFCFCFNETIWTLFNVSFKISGIRSAISSTRWSSPNGWILIGSFNPNIRYVFSCAITGTTGIPKLREWIILSISSLVSWS